MSADQKWKNNFFPYNKQSSSQQGHFNVQNLLNKLQDLSEVQDQSRNQQSPVFIDENSISNKNNSRILDNIFDKQESPHIKSTNQNSLRQNSPPRESNRQKCCLQYISNEQKLRKINERLLEDNKKLFSQCLKLRKEILIKTQKEAQIKAEKRFKKSKIQQQQNTNEIEKLKQLQFNQLSKFQKVESQKHDLLKKLKEYKKQLKKMRQKEQTLNIKQLLQNLTFFEQQNQTLKERIQELQREKESQKLNRTYSMSTATQDTRSIDNKDRIITNMKIVHESQLKKLKLIIEQQKKQLQTYQPDKRKQRQFQSQRYENPPSLKSTWNDSNIRRN